MKRARKTHHNNDSSSKTRVSEVYQNSNCNTKNNAATLDEVRAKLEQARMKKIAAEERLLRQRQHEPLRTHQQELLPPTSTPTKVSAITMIVKQSLTGDVAATTTTTHTSNVVTNRQGTVSNLINNSTTRAQEAQVALDRARSKLQGALQNRERALLQQRMNNTSSPFDPQSNNTNSSWNRKRRSSQGRYAAHSNLPPISALSHSFSLTITDISRTGPPDAVYHYMDSIDSSISCMSHPGSRTGLEAALGGKEAIEALHRGSTKSNYGDGCNNIRSRNNITNKNGKRTVASTTTTKKDNLTSTSLVQRKFQLQNELMALKEKLEMKSSQEQKQKQQHPKPQTTNATTADNGDGRNRKTTTKEGLERRKAEAQTVMDISYWKHFVSKQEHLLEQVTTKINNMDDWGHRHQKKPRGAMTHKECLHKRHVTNKAIAKVHKDLDIIENRQKVVEEGIVLSIQKLLEARQDLHEERNRKVVENQDIR